MVTRDQAANIALQMARGLFRPSEGDSIELVESATTEVEVGWVFFYNTRRYLETGDVLQALMGNAPILVFGESGEATTLRYALGLERSIQRAVEQRQLAAGPKVPRPPDPDKRAS